MAGNQAANNLEPYDAAHYDPPAPAARVTLRAPDAGATGVDAALLMDTGADVTLLPREAVQRLGVPVQAGRAYELVGFEGSRAVAESVMLDMIFLGRAYRGLYLLIDGEFGVLGRDVLNHVALLFDGPARQWSQRLP